MFKKKSAPKSRPNEKTQTQNLKNITPNKSPRLTRLTHLAEAKPLGYGGIIWNRTNPFYQMVQPFCKCRKKKNPDSDESGFHEIVLKTFL